jgi:hypothetical protein
LAAPVPILMAREEAAEALFGYAAASIAIVVRSGIAPHRPAAWFRPARADRVSAT